MNKRIYKYELTYGIDTIFLPEGSKILSVQEQAGMVMMWVECYPKLPSRCRIIKTFKTGAEIPKEVADSIEFLATVTVGSIVYHIFDGGWKTV